ncbi:MAG: hypothetical protein D6791_16460 [Chloroflexi bacterium]|nr:MAG: hypothetical protein D6791_16460 [Chloroflexota bacterium]
MLIPEVVIYGFALWLGLYLIARDLASPRLRLAGLGLVAYALGLAGDILARHAPTPVLALRLTRLGWPLLFLPALLWSGATLYLLPEDAALRLRLARAWEYGVLLLAGLVYAVGSQTPLMLTPTPQGPGAGPAYPAFAIAVLAFLIGSLYLVGRAFRSARPKKALAILLVATLFLTLSTSLLIFPLGRLPRPWVLLAIGGDLMLLGIAIAALDAFDQGEALLADALWSFDFAFLTALLFAGQVALAMRLATGVTFPMLTLLLLTIATAIGVATLSSPIQSALERLSFAPFPRLRTARASLRAAADALPRINETLDLETMDEDEFVRLTRRALSHFGDLPRLATSPLTRLPLVEARLAERGASDNTLERAAELKTILTESIARLKPRDQGDFGTSDEWRYYNALYFPYVVGLKPYSRRAQHDGLDPASREALDWFRTYVPERTLYNWQNAAAKLVAQDLRERSRRVPHGSDET